VIGDDRQRFGGCSRQAARLLARAPKQMGEIGRRLEMPAATTLDELDPAALVSRGELTERDLDRAFAYMLGNFLETQRLRRGEESGFDRTH
jgi:hypothetical protein